METTTRELPLLPATDEQAGPPPTMRAAGDAPTRPLAVLPAPAAAPPGPPPFSPPPADAGAGRAEVAAMPRPAAQVAQERPALGTPAAPPRPRRRWPVALASWFGGMAAGMLVLLLALAAFGGPRSVSASTGDPTAAWDSSITLTDAYLTAQARKNGTGQVQEPTLRVQADGTLALEGKIGLFGRSVPLNAKLQPSLADGKLQMAIVSMQVGGLPLPEVVVNQVQNGVAGAAQPPAGTMPTTIVKLEASEGKLVIFSKVK